MKFLTRSSLIFFGLFGAGCGAGAPHLSHTGVCDGYSDWTLSSFVLPWSVGSEYEVSQGNCGPASHFGPYRYAYDFIMDIGTTITAVRGGLVVEALESKSDGNGCSDGANYLAILHDDGTVSEYVHLTKDGALVSVGDTVVAGTPVALSGNTGCSSSPHLHFSVYRDTQRKETIPISFSNTRENPRGLITGKKYRAQ